MIAGMQAISPIKTPCMSSVRLFDTSLIKSTLSSCYFYKSKVHVPCSNERLFPSFPVMTSLLTMLPSDSCLFRRRKRELLAEMSVGDKNRQLQPFLFDMSSV
jgi:hypothetical protein